MAVPAQSSLSANRRRLVELMQRIDFGSIEHLVVHDGEPVLDDPAIRVVWEVKLAGGGSACPEAPASDFKLKAQIVDLFSHFARLRYARIEVLTVKHGLPFSMHVEGAA